MSSSIASVAAAPRKPDVSIVVWMPISFAPRRMRAANAGCISTSPPERVMPPPVAANTPR